jgi:hypothetical protein
MKKILLAVSAVLTMGIAESSAQCGVFYDGFESGTFGPPWTMGTGTYTVTVPNTTPAVGTYNLQLASTVSNSFYEGARVVFTASQPTYMSWWMKTNTTNAANGYVVIGDGNIAADNGVIFCYFNAASGLRFFNTGGYNHPIVANTWYHVEARNINWTSRTSDIYVNNVLILPGWAFRSGTATTIDRVHMFSLSAATAEYDEITVGSMPVTATAVQTNVDCFGNANGSATVSASGGDGTYTYSWSPSGGTSATATGLAPNTYVCTITDGVGCTTTQTVVITEPPALAITSSQTNVLCNGGFDGTASVIVTGGTPGYTYMWSPTGGTSATASGLTAGTYVCTPTDANGCSTSVTVTVTEPTPLVTAAANNGDVCAGDTAMLVGTAMGGTMGYTYTWLPGNLNGSVVGTTPATTTTYSLVVTDANGCMDTSTTTVTVNALPVVALGADITQCGGSVVLDAGNAGSSYFWNDGSLTQMINVSATDIYHVAVTDTNGCTGHDTINVTINPLPAVVGSASMNFVCTGEPTINLFGSPANGTWTGPGVFGSTFEPDTAGVGTHALVYAYTDSLSCTAMDTVSITVDLCLGMNEGVAVNYIVYPNPNNGTFMLAVNAAITDLVVEITDVQGRVVYTSSDANVQGGFTKQVSLENEASGIYFMRITADGVSSVQKISIQK